MIDFKLNFKSSAERIRADEQRRRALAGRVLPFNVGFFDDYCRGILPHDLIVVGAWSGIGKTTLATIIAQQAAKTGKRVFLFALEAEENEIERRMLYREIAQRAWNTPEGPRLNYPDWLLGKFGDDPFVQRFESEVVERIGQDYSTLHTYYRESRAFTKAELTKLLLAVQDKADLVVVDHLHYIDLDDDENENRGLKRVVQTIRDAALSTGVPMIVVAHLRKRDRGRFLLVPETDDFHGSSDITKIATRVLVIAPANIESKESSKRNTFLAVRKDRQVGATDLVAMVRFDIGAFAYENCYRLGRLSFRGDEWTQLAGMDVPSWAKGAVR